MDSGSSRRGLIRVVGPDADDAAVVSAEIRRRYSADYDIGASSDPEDALEELRRLHAVGAQVALVLACQHGTDEGVEFLARVGAIQPQARRVLVLR